MKRAGLMTLMAVALGVMGFASVKSNGGNGSIDLLATVTIAGTRWTTANLTADAGATSGHRIGAPQDYGSYFKWGSKYTYDNTNVGEGWGDYTTGAATNPTTSSTNNRGYDYIGLSGGTAHPGDPCQSLGANYKTPTRAQWAALEAEGRKWGAYKGINGYFFGANASSCTNATIADGCIFLPASGLRNYNTGALELESSNGYYWSSSVYDANYGYYLNFDNGGYISPEYNYVRSLGLSVRCVQQ